MEKNVYQEKANSVVALTLNQINAMKIDEETTGTIRLDLWRALDKEFRDCDCDYYDAADNVLNDIIDRLELYGFSEKQIKAVDATLESLLEKYFDESVGNR